jgi:transcriptional regulator with PAS, ATPase and Fis domain
MIRRLERMSRSERAAKRGEMLEAARRVLGARSISIINGNNEDSSVLHDHAGTAPGDELLGGLEALLSTANARDDAMLEGTVGGLRIMASAITGNPKQFLVATFSGNVSGSWRRDFLSYLTGKVAPRLEASDTAAHDAPARLDNDLDVPAGMILGSSPAMEGLLRHLRVTVKSDLDVLLLGETGTGKELFAKLIHRSGPTAAGPFVAVNCAAIPTELLEAELFGVMAGAATGVEARLGHFMEANGGTIFLDEITEMSGHLHAKLLRALQEREVLPVGSSRARKISVRVISACNRDLATLVREGRFRADLYYRLRRLQFHIPPLRERREDLPEILLSFVNRFASKWEKRVAGVSRKALRILTEHDWPGNIRELETEVERAVLLCPDGGTLESDHFGSVKWELARRAQESAGDGRPQAAAPSSAAQADAGELQAKLDAVERQAITSALARAGGNKTKAATFLGVTRNGLRLKMQRLGIKFP